MVKPRGPQEKKKRTARVRTPEERSRSARKGWKTQNRPENLYKSMVKAATKYRKTSQKSDYSRYRAIKRRVYRVLGDKDKALAFSQKACIEAEWEAGVAMKFAKLS